MRRLRRAKNLVRCKDRHPSTPLRRNGATDCGENYNFAQVAYPSEKSNPLLTDTRKRACPRHLRSYVGLRGFFVAVGSGSQNPRTHRALPAAQKNPFLLDRTVDRAAAA